MDVVLPARRFIRYEDRLFGSNDSNRIIAFTEKHGTRRFIGSTPELMAKALIKVLTDRINDGYWYDDTPVEGQDQLNLFRKPALTDAEKVRQILAKANENLIEAGKLAYTFLQSRNGYEHEEFDIEYLEPLEGH